MLVFRRLLATIVVLWVVAFLSQLTWGRAPADSLLRLSWRTNGEEVRIPRVQDANLPAHMRLPEDQAYDARIRPYRLQVSLDGREVLDRLIDSPGLRHDRPISVFQEFTVAPGNHALEVNFTPQAVEGAPAPEPTKPYRSKLEFQAGRVALLTLDAESAWLLKGGRDE